MVGPTATRTESLRAPDILLRDVASRGLVLRSRLVPCAIGVRRGLLVLLLLGLTRVRQCVLPRPVGIHWRLSLILEFPVSAIYVQSHLLKFGKVLGPPTFGDLALYALR